MKAARRHPFLLIGSVIAGFAFGQLASAQEWSDGLTFLAFVGLGVMVVGTLVLTELRRESVRNRRFPERRA